MFTSDSLVTLKNEEEEEEMFWKYYSCLSSWGFALALHRLLAAWSPLASHQMSKGRSSPVTRRQGHHRHIWDTRSPFPMGGGGPFWHDTSWQRWWDTPLPDPGHHLLSACHQSSPLEGRPLDYGLPPLPPKRSPVTQGPHPTITVVRG